MKKAMKLVSLVLAVVMLLGCLTACGSKSATTDATASTDTASNDTAAASDGGEIVIALISNTTGDYAQYGQPVRDGAMLYINQLNANGGMSRFWNTMTRATALRLSTRTTSPATTASPLSSALR